MSQFNTLKKHPFLLLITGLIAVDLAMVGSVFGSTLTPAARIDQLWCWVRPFAWAGSRVDLFLLSLAGSQLALTTIWSFHSKQFIGIRALAWFGVGLVWAILLSVLHFATYSMVDLTATFLYQTLGLIGGLIWYRRRGYRLVSRDDRNQDVAARRQFTLTEMLFFLTVAGAVCMVLSWLTMIVGSGSFLYRWLFWIEPSRHLRQLIEMTTLGVVAAMMVRACFAERHALSRVIAVLATACAAGWLIVFLRLQYAQFVTLSVTDNELEMMPGWIAWFGLQPACIAVLLLSLRPLGWRFARPQQAAPAVSAGKWRGLKRTIAAVGALLAAIAMAYFAVVLLPQYRANRRLIKETDHVGVVWNQPSGGRVLFVAQQPIDDVVVDALNRHPIVTHVHVFNLQTGDGTLPRLRKLQFLSGITIFAKKMSREEADELRRALPNATVDVHYVGP